MSCSTSNMEEVENFFSGLLLPTISCEQREKLEAPITEEEIRATISYMKTGRSPGAPVSDSVPVRPGTSAESAVVPAVIDEDLDHKETDNGLCHHNRVAVRLCVT